MTDPLNRITRTIVQVLVGLAGAVPLVSYVHLPPGAAAAVAAGLVVAVTVLHNIADALGLIQKIAPSSAAPYVVDAEDVVAHLEDIAGELSQHLVTTKAAAPAAPTAVAPAPVPDVAGGDVAAVNPNVLHREATNVPTA